MDGNIDPMNMPGAGGGRGAKKKEKNSTAKRNQLLIAFLVVNSICLAVPFLWNYEDDFAWKTYAAQTFVSYKTGSVIVNSIKDGFEYEYYFDIFVLNLVVQLLSLYSEYAYLLYLIVPGVILYKGIRMLLSWVFTPTADEQMEDNPDPKLLKKQQKAERKRQRQRVVR
uniref:Uncharacterized protein n=1 Tax=Aplanochytrium stocchinoi TaxID=215587 RepID=A0A7S3PIF2_9STRA|mmetsp:Transcript_18115/g.22319  ORF Transcript_18115/g.22319 Transcript_18115/m.22319 type:complete len:168 (+) Transcript_18115:315-818(+)|eukprot:CAMPEP_0204829876 /NCGR_PEP_ID=MMETSP1346-20131115/8201_1 /ASSEMBLY_ACC=CAM_ASM_000771 /TAXON_ID=215587 /ORGANISM="Aplanochytrium stocchinoi, Strain GSBS06" /LENGTH=167 /DNA_ID=CAMNT_0051959967 /DNA_START=251 /DNA_END=754 /DNA_ORIENTATION=-